MRPFNYLENMNLSDTYWRVLLACMKFRLFKTTTRMQSGTDAFVKSRLVIMAFLTNLGVTEILCCFRSVLEGKTGEKIPESLR